MDYRDYEDYRDYTAALLTLRDHVANNGVLEVCST